MKSNIFLTLFIFIIGCQHSSMTRKFASNDKLLTQSGLIRINNNQYQFAPFFDNDPDGDYMSFFNIEICDGSDTLKGQIDEALDAKLDYINFTTTRNSDGNKCILDVQVPIHGGWSYFNRPIPITKCNDKSDYQLESKQIRSCINPAPAFNGRNCIGGSTKYKYCSGTIVIK